VGVGAGVKEQPVVETLAFAAGAGREALPSALGGQCCEFVGADPPGRGGNRWSQEMAIT
jgi:hypothetical protein